MRYILAAVLLGALIAPVGASAQSAKQQVRDTECKARDEVLRLLSAHFGESRVWSGVSTGGTLNEMYASKKGSWTYTVTFPNSGMAGEDVTCISSFGNRSAEGRDVNA